jgi:peroxiredoxin Q/BCP
MIFKAKICKTTPETETEIMLKVGQTAPLFKARLNTGREVSLRSYVGRWVVLFFYPKDNTAGCTKQVCAFRDSFQAFVDAKTVVIGVSRGSKGEHQDFVDKHALPFALITDLGDALRKQYQVPKDLWLIPGRVTYVINPEGEIAFIFNSQLNPVAHVEEALRLIQSNTPVATPHSRTL